MRLRTVARIILGLDAAGCAAAAVTLALSPRAARVVDPSLRSRQPVIAALAGTAGVLGIGAGREAGLRESLQLAALMNSGWVAGCLVALCRRPTRPATALIATTAALDAGAAAAQCYLAICMPTDREAKGFATNTFPTM